MAEIFEVLSREQSQSDVNTPLSFSGNLRRHWMIESATDETDARNALNDIPLIVDGLFLRNRRLRELGNGTWEVDAEYGPISESGRPLEQPLEEGEIRLTFTGTTDTRHVTHGQLISSHVQVGAPEAIDLLGAINVDLSDPKKPEVNGIDIRVPVLRMTLERGSSHELVFDDREVARVAQYFGHVNSNTFFGFRPGEVLFIGSESTVRASDDGSQTRTISYEFDMQPNLFNIPIGANNNPILVPEKQGWDVVSILQEPLAEDGPVGLQIFPYTRQADVIRVYPRVNFSVLGLQGLI